MTDPAADDYDQIWQDVYGGMQDHGPVHQHLGRLVARELAPLPYRTVYEVGCGAGHNFDLLTRDRSVERLGGMDISEVALRAARTRSDGEFLVGDVQEVAIEGTWDLVFCSLVLEHLSDDVAALRNMHGAVGRWLLVTTIGGDYARYERWERRVGHVRNYAPGELEEKLERTGYKVQRLIRWGWPFYSPIARTLQRGSSVGTGEFGLLERAAAATLSAVYHLNSSRRGDIVIALATPAS